MSPTLVLSHQRGNCFDYAVLLCSLLVGVGYDAYCVCGYATQEVSQHNLTRKTCPLLIEKEEAKVDKQEETREHYTVRPPRDLSSMFEKRMVDKERAREEEEIRKKQEEEDAKRAVSTIDWEIFKCIIIMVKVSKIFQSEIFLARNFCDLRY